MPPEEEHRVEIHLDRLLAERGISLTAICDALDCQPADLLTVRPGPRRGQRA